MRRWLLIASCVVSIGCAAEDEGPGESVSVDDGDGGDRVVITKPPPGGGSSSSSGDGDGDASTDDPVTMGTKLSDLTDSQLDRMCDDTKEIFDDALSRAEFTKIACTYRALVDVKYDPGDVLVVNEASCKELVSDCVTLSTGERTFRCETDDFLSAAMDCDGFSEDYLACARVSAGAFADAVELFTCENLADPDEVEDAFKASTLLDPFTHRQCEAIVRKCPELFLNATRGEPAADGCDDTCGDKMDGWCDDGGEDSQSSLCPLGTDCTDCGERSP